MKMTLMTPRPASKTLAILEPKRIQCKTPSPSLRMSRRILLRMRAGIRKGLSGCPFAGKGASAVSRSAPTSLASRAVCGTPRCHPDCPTACVSVLGRQRTIGGKQPNSIGNELHVEPSLNAKLQVLVEPLAILYLVHSLRSSGTCHLHSLPCKPAPCRCVHSR